MRRTIGLILLALLVSVSAVFAQDEPKLQEEPKLQFVVSFQVREVALSEKEDAAWRNFYAVIEPELLKNGERIRCEAEEMSSYQYVVSAYRNKGTSNQEELIDAWAFDIMQFGKEGIESFFFGQIIKPFAEGTGYIQFAIQKPIPYRVFAQPTMNQNQANFLIRIEKDMGSTRLSCVTEPLP